jgi:hypothetical protein
MKKFTMFAVLAMAMVFALASYAGDQPRVTVGDGMLYGGSANFAKAVGDTIDLMGPTGSGAAYLGDFEAGWNGWTTVDVTKPTVTHFQVSNYNQAVATNLAAWCGDIGIVACGLADTAGGYGNSWHDLISYKRAVANPAASAQVTVTAFLQNDTEPGYDYTRVSVKKQGELGYTDLASWDDKQDVNINQSYTYLPSELVGGTQVYVLFRVQSDGGWSDGDCSWPTRGACQIDDVTVTITQAGEADIVSFTDFQDGTFGDWALDFPDGTGDFSQLWKDLEDADACASNYSQQVAFIDDGVVVPGTGGSDCVSWCYGPSGYTVNVVGGIAGSAAYLQNDIFSPVMTWPGTNDGMLYSWDAYIHMYSGGIYGTGVYYTWGVRSADTDDSAGFGVQDISTQEFQDRNFVYYGGPLYRRDAQLVTDLVNPGRDELQVKLGVYELGWVWGYTATDASPAPYFDNVSIKIFPATGPQISARALDLANDGFPAVDAINVGDLGSLSVRFDMANNISLRTHNRNDPGDSIVMDITPGRAGAALTGAPQLFYTMKANPLFDAYRTSPTSGSAAGVAAVINGNVSLTRWTFDLPDTGLIFPGDRLHYYITATDDISGASPLTTTLPADTTGFNKFASALSYSNTFEVRGLPTLFDDGFGTITAPGVIFWNDQGGFGGEQEWFSALANAGLVDGEDYDVYTTNGASSGVGNGIGGRTSGLALEYYNDMLYTSGPLSAYTLSNGNFANDAGNDIGALVTWMSAGNKDLFMTGDGVAAEMATGQGGPGTTMLSTIMGLNFTANDVRPFIGNQTTPLVLTIGGGANPVFQNISSWLAYGGCPGVNTFDAVTPVAAATRLAEFADPNNAANAYTWSAATLNTYNVTNRVVSMPYDLQYVWNDSGAKVAAPLSARSQVVKDVLSFFGVEGAPENVTAVVPGTRFTTQSYPNPFNPATKISYTIKGAGHLTLKVYNVRGQLVKTLVDGNVTQDGFVMWDGTNSEGGNVASGVYFYEARMGNDVQVNKMALVK